MRLSVSRSSAAFFGSAVLGALALPAAAQTTHQVDLFSVTFSPDSLTIQQGDTVRFNWVVGFHNVVSGDTDFQAIFPDGVFDTGQPTVGDTFEFTFDGAVIANFPKPGNVYPYFCSVHLPVMIATIQVTGLSGSVEAYGPANPAGSLRFAKGDARIGKPMTFEIDNPVNPNAGPGVALLLAATSPDPNFPNGTSVPGYGLGAGAAGDFLLSLAPPNPFLQLGPVGWAGSGSPASIVLPLPNNPALVGVDLYFQGAVVDPTLFFPIGITNGLRATIGA